jgi:phosphatidylserine/phosphatidylglycerophosphate/cardiolipin synthase-like enzyme
MDSPALAFSLPSELPLGLSVRSIEMEFERLIAKTWKTLHIFSFSHNTTMAFELNATMLAVLKNTRPNIHIYTNDKGTAERLHAMFSRVSSSVETSYWTKENSSFHIKSIVVDRKDVYLGSANFSISALRENAEAGLFFESENIAESLIEYAEILTTAGLLVPLGG